MNETRKPDNAASAPEAQEAPTQSGEQPEVTATAKSATSDDTAASEQPAAPSTPANGPATAATGSPTKTDSSAKPTASSGGNTPPPTTPATPQKTPAGWPGKLALLLALIALIAVGWLYWQGWQLQQRTASLDSDVNDRVNAELSAVTRRVDQELGSVSSQLSALQSQAQTEQQNVQQLQQRLTDAIKQVNARRETSRSNWLLAEAEYLLRLANQRILMEQTASGALTLLKATDEILHEVDDVSLYDVRQALAEDIAALEAVPALDIEGVYLKLAALNKQVDALRVTPVTDKRQLPSMLEEITPEAVEETWTAGAQAAWNRALEKFEKLVVIQHRDEPVEPLLSPEQTYYLQQNLHLMLEQAQLALLQRKQQAFDAALEKAEQWISTYFDARDATTQALLRGIGELADTEVSPTLPDISGSLKALQDYLREMTRLKQEAGQ